MKINTKVRYGLRAMIDIAEHQEKGSTLQKVIAERQEIPIKFLDIIITGLKNNGLILSKAGKGTGYRLTRNPDQISVYDIDRGGDITYHGPGQIVGYPIIDLNNWYKDTHKYLRELEEVIITTCGDYGLNSERNSKHTGVWVGDRKIAAIGIKVSRWITMHGFAFNVNTDLSLFNGIIPCGIQDKSVTSLSKELNREISIQEVKDKLLKNFSDVFNYNKVFTKQREEILQTSFTTNY